MAQGAQIGKRLDPEVVSRFKGWIRAKGRDEGQWVEALLLWVVECEDHERSKIWDYYLATMPEEPEEQDPKARSQGKGSGRRKNVTA